MATKRSPYQAPETASELVRRTAFGVGVAVAATLLVQVLVEAIGVNTGGSGPMSPFDPLAIVGTTVAAGAGAAIVYAVLDRLTDRPVRNFVVAAVVVFVLQLVPVFVFTPSLGVTLSGQVVLVVYHFLVAIPLVAFIVGLVPR